MRAIRWLYVNARLAVRWAVLYITGRRYTLRVMANQKGVFEIIARRIVDQRLFLARRETDNRSLLTGMVVALIAGHSQFLSGWERYKFAARRKSNYRTALAGRIVGRPVVYDNKRVKIGMTDWHQDYVPRREQLAARGRRKYV